MTGRALELARGRARAGAWRLRYAAWPVLQTAVAATVAWYAAQWLLGHERPLFAAIAAIVTLGIPVGAEISRAVQVVFGVGLGAALASLLVLIVGMGPAQLALVVALSMLTVAFLGAERLLVTQVGISSVLVVALGAEGGPLSPGERLLDALLGAGLAVCLSALFPINPEWRTREAAGALLDGLVATLGETASALAGGDNARAERALHAARALDGKVAGVREAIAAGREAALISPFRRRDRRRLGDYAAAVDHLDLAVRNARVLARDAVAGTASGEPSPEPLPDAVRDLARAADALRGRLEEPGRSAGVDEFAAEAAKKAAASLTGRDDVATNALVSQVRATATDLLRASGADPAAGPEEAPWTR